MIKLKNILNEGFPRELTAKDYITNKSLKHTDESIWAVFYMDGGKYFLSRLYKRNLQWNETKLKYGHPETLKFNYDMAIKVAKINKPNKKRIGIVNDKGVQHII